MIKPYTLQIVKYPEAGTPPINKEYLVYISRAGGCWVLRHYMETGWILREWDGEVLYWAALPINPKFIPQ